jgi:hypothetical protein
VGVADGKEVGNGEKTCRSVGETEGVSVLGVRVGLFVGLIVGFLDGETVGEEVFTVGERVECLKEGIRVGLEVLGGKEGGSVF